MIAPLSIKHVASLAVCAALLGACAPANQAARPAPSQDTAAQQAPAKPKITATELLGQTNGWLLAKLGEPAFRRTDRHANMWQYKNATCVLNVFLYAEDTSDNGGTASRVLHFDARTLGGGNADRAACLSALQD